MNETPNEMLWQILAWFEARRAASSLPELQKNIRQRRKLITAMRALADAEDIALAWQESAFS